MTQRTRQIATAALGISPAERDRFVRDQCADDEAMRLEVDRLIALEESVTIVPFSEPATRQPSASMTDRDSSDRRTAPSPTSPTSDRCIGGYRVLERLGAGAMGVVYLAEQPNPKRRIALKVIRPDIASPDLRDRFAHETRVLARLRHPGIAAIYEAGNAIVDGIECPYFAMELVTGRPLDEHARMLSPRDKARLMLGVCAAVEHAHQRGVVHRDLKPANILVDEQGRAKVLDFGIARAVDGERGSGELAGTLPYMSPEQLDRSPDVDTRADVYALGVTLFELLVGSKPHELRGLDPADAAALIREQSPPSPRAIDRCVSRDLDAIVRRALAPHPEARYASAGALADELGRTLRNEPVSARPQTAGYVLGRFAKRNRGLVIAASVAVATMLSGGAATGWLAIDATRGWAEAKREADRAEAVNGFLTSMLSSADPESALGQELTIRELLDGTAATLDANLPDNPSVEVAVRVAIANTYRGLGELDRSERQARRAYAVALRSFGLTDLTTVDAQRTLAMTLIELGRHNESEEVLRIAEQTLHELPGDRVMDLAMVRGDLARIYYESGQPEPALRTWSEALAVMQASAGREDEHTLVLLHNYGSALGLMGRYRESEKVLAEVVTVRNRVFSPEHPQTIAARSMLAGVIQKQGRDAEAAEQFRLILDARRRLLGDAHHSTLTAMGNLAVSLIASGELAEAESLTRAALEGYRQTLGDEHAKTLTTMGNLAYILEDLGRTEEAAELYREQISIRDRATGGRDPETWSTLNNLAMLYQNHGRLDEALPLYERLLALCEESLPPDHIYTALFRNNYGDALLLDNRPNEARRELELSHEIIDARFGPDHPRTIKSRDRLDRMRTALRETR